MPSDYLLEHYNKLLKVFQRYFTCEGRFTKVYQYYIMILMNFSGKKILNLPFFLFRSSGKMAKRVRMNKGMVDTILFNFSLTKLLILEELQKKR